MTAVITGPLGGTAGVLLSRWFSSIDRKRVETLAKQQEAQNESVQVQLAKITDADRFRENLIARAAALVEQLETAKASVEHWEKEWIKASQETLTWQSKAREVEEELDRVRLKQADLDKQILTLKESNRQLTADLAEARRKREELQRQYDALELRLAQCPNCPHYDMIERAEARKGK